MGRTTNKIRQVFNLFLLLFFVVVAAGTLIWFLTAPERRGEATFWISMGFLAFAALLVTLFASKVALRGDAGRSVPGSFSQLFVMTGYLIFAVIAAVAAARLNLSETGCFLLHVGGAAVFLIPLLLTNMAMLKLSGADRREQREGRQTLAWRAGRVGNMAQDLERFLPAEDLAPLRRLSESLRYSDPNPAPKMQERALDAALEALEAAASRLSEISENADGGQRQEEVLRACTLAARALEERNQAVLNSK